jgi:hypothetical protein
MLGYVHAQSLIHGIGSMPQSSIELILGCMSGPGPDAIQLSGSGRSSDVCEGSSALSSNPESHMFGILIIGRAGTTTTLP